MSSIGDANTKLLSRAFSGTSCFVTGHTGFKGSWLCLWLEKLGAKLTGYALDPNTKPNNLYDLAGVGTGLTDIRGDIRHAEHLMETLLAAAPKVVFHLAAQPIVRESYVHAKDTFDINVSGTVNVLEAARKCPSIKAIVIVTSDKCYANRNWMYSYREEDPLGGHDPYSASKAACDIVAQSYGKSFFEPNNVTLVTVRAGNVIGGGDWAADRIVPDIVRAIAKGEPVSLRSPEATRPWQHVLEPLSGYLLLAARILEASSPSEALALTGPWNFGPPTASSQSVRVLVEAFLKHYRKGTWRNESQGSGQYHEASRLALSWDKAHAYLGWKPRWDFAKTLEIVATWYRQQQLGEMTARALCMREIEAYTTQL